MAGGRGAGAASLNASTPRPGEGSSFLATNGQTLPSAGADAWWPECRSGVWVWCRGCGLQFPARCGRNACEWCGPVNALQTARAIALAEPERSYLLTLAGDDFQTVRARVNRLRYDVRQEVGPFFDCWHVEPNPEGTGHHVHGLQHGRFVPVETFRRMADRRGFGRWVGLSRVRSASSAALYGVKLAAMAAAAYSLKGASADLEMFLRANGGRMVHASRGFWREGKGGGTLPGVGAARTIARWRVKGPQLCPASGEPHSFGADFIRPVEDAWRL